jgi:precorrin-6A/cobalt-precorrin-6A reductase
MDTARTGAPRVPPAPLRLLLLGGTGEARLLATWLQAVPGVHALSSLAGRGYGESPPPGPVRTGGFGAVAGLVDHLRRTGTDAVVDATHPFAAQITAHAVTACTETGLPLLVLRRRGWREQPGDRWLRVPDLEAAATRAATLPPGTVLLTTGRTGLPLFAADPGHRYLARVLDPALAPPPPGIQFLTRTGPCDIDAELALLLRFKITTVVTKDSGGPDTAAKLVAARELALPVIVVDRPPLPVRAPAVATVEEALDWIRSLARDGLRDPARHESTDRTEPA